MEIYDARSAETFAPSHDSGDSHYHVSMPTASRKDVCPLAVQLLGGLRLTRGGEDIRLPRRKVETLFAYLLLHREAHSREKLASLGWGDFPDAQARASLRNALAVLRKLLGEDCLLTDSASVQLNPSFAVQVDACEFETATDPAAAIALYRGDLLPDCYDEWVSGERERL